MRRKKLGTAATCEQCAASFIVKSSPSVGRFCSPACGYAWRRAHDGTEARCLQCGVDFLAKHGKREMYCSPECGFAALRSPRTAKEPSPVEGCRWLALTKGQFALVDGARYEELSAHLWRATKGGACTTVSGRRVALHQMLLGRPWVDHRNGNVLDNREINLRPATATQNAWNSAKKRRGTSAFKGVYRHAGRFYATIRVAGQRVFVGSFAVETDAAKAYDNAARESYGEFACVNFPRSDERGALQNAS